MPLSGNEFIQRDSDSILSFLEAELRSEFGEDIDLTESSAFRTFATAIAEADAEQLQPALEEVYNSALLSEASGELLEDLVYVLGIERREAIHATGTVTFQHGSLVTQDYTIPNGTTVQTDSQDPTQFETTQLVTLSWFDDFESGSLRAIYGGDTGSFGVVDTAASSSGVEPTDGEYVLEADGSGHIYNTADKTEIGDEFTYQTYLTNETATSADVAHTFGVIDSENYYRIRVGADNTHAIEKVVGGTPQTIASRSPTTPVDEWLRVEVVWSPESNATITSRLIGSGGGVIDEVSATDLGDDIAVGGYGFESIDGTEPVVWDHSAQTAATANIRAAVGGPDGNVGANTIVSMPSVPNGVNSVTNKYQTGDDEHYLTTLTRYTLGRPREDDDELRARATSSGGANGSGTVPSLIANARALPGVQSVSVFENLTSDDNTGSGGLPPNSFELVIYGDTPRNEIASMLHETRAFTAEPYGGARGQAVSETIEASNGQTFTMEWSEPTQLHIDMTLDIVVTDEYIGDDELRDRIVEYVGGTNSDGTSELGLGVGEDVYISQLEDAITGPDNTGVVGVSDSSYTPSVTTDSNGLSVVAVGANETSATNAEDGSITLNTTQV